MKPRLMKAVALDAVSSKSSQAKRPAMVKRSANQSPHNILIQYCTASRRTQRGWKHDRHLHQVDLGVSIIHLGRRNKKKGKQNDGGVKKPIGLSITQGGENMEYESEINELKKRVDELEKCCAEFRACQGPMGERVAALEQKA